MKEKYFEFVARLTKERDEFLDKLRSDGNIEAVILKVYEINYKNEIISFLENNEEWLSEKFENVPLEDISLEYLYYSWLGWSGERLSDFIEEIIKNKGGD